MSRRCRSRLGFALGVMAAGVLARAAAAQASESSRVWSAGSDDASVGERQSAPSYKQNRDASAQSDVILSASNGIASGHVIHEPILLKRAAANGQSERYALADESVAQFYRKISGSDMPVSDANIASVSTVEPVRTFETSSSRVHIVESIDISSEQGVEAETETEIETETEAEADPDAGSEAETEVEIEATADENAEVESETETDIPFASSTPTQSFTPTLLPTPMPSPSMTPLSSPSPSPSLSSIFEPPVIGPLPVVEPGEALIVFYLSIASEQQEAFDQTLNAAILETSFAQFSDRSQSWTLIAFNPSRKVPSRSRSKFERLAFQDARADYACVCAEESALELVESYESFVKQHNLDVALASDGYENTTVVVDRPASIWTWGNASSGLSAGAIAGIAIGAVCAALLLAALVAWLVLRSRSSGDGQSSAVVSDPDVEGDGMRGVERDAIVVPSESTEQAPRDFENDENSIILSPREDQYRTAPGSPSNVDNIRSRKLMHTEDPFV